MNKEAIFLFLILLLGLILCSFLGGNCNREGLTNKNIVYKGPDGSTAIIITNIDGTKSIQVTGSQVVLFNQSSTSTNKFTNSYGYTATLSGGKIVITDSNGKTITFIPSNDSSYNDSSYYNINYDNYNHYDGSSSSQLMNGSTFMGPNGGRVDVVQDKNGKQMLIVKLTSNSNVIVFNQSSFSNGVYGYINKFYGPTGFSVVVIKTADGSNAITVKTPRGNYLFISNYGVYNPDYITSTQYYGSTGYPIQTSSYNLSYNQPNSDYYNSYLGPYGGSAGAISNSQGNTLPNDATGKGYGTDYNSALPKGVSKSQIPPGKEDLYILKSEVVPPVCPVCPTSSACPRQEKCPPCPACARCPEPAFDCKKVPNYNAIDNEFLPQPILNNFSQFGM